MGTYPFPLLPVKTVVVVVFYLKSQLKLLWFNCHKICMSYSVPYVLIITDQVPLCIPHLKCARSSTLLSSNLEFLKARYFTFLNTIKISKLECTSNFFNPANC